MANQRSKVRSVGSWPGEPLQLTLKHPSWKQIAGSAYGAHDDQESTARPHVRLRRGDPSHFMQRTRVAPDDSVPSLMHRRRVMEKTITYVGLDVHKEPIAVALAEGGLAPRHATTARSRTHRPR